MSNSLQTTTSPQTDHPPPSPVETAFEIQHGFTSLTLSSTDVTPLATDRILCTICVDTPASAFDHAFLPSCNHTFCLPCLVSWASIRPLCPNCKAPFTSVLSRRALTDGCAIIGPPSSPARGHPAHGHPVHELQLSALCNAAWLHLHPIHSPKHDIEASFSLPPHPSIEQRREAAQGSSMTATTVGGGAGSPHVVNEEVEDELEHRVWQEEAHFHEALMRTTRTISNRRFGAAGYISSGRMRATPRPPRPPQQQQQQQRGKSATVPPRARASAVPSASSAADGKQIAGGRQQQQGRGGGRKKKLKKKSRAGIAAAAAAAEAAALAAAVGNEVTEENRNGSVNAAAGSAGSAGSSSNSAANVSADGG